MNAKRCVRRTIFPRDQYRRWVDARVASLRLTDVVAYMLDRGWKEILPAPPPGWPGYRAFQEPTGAIIEGHPVCQFVPLTEADDLRQRMFELLTGLAEYEDRQAAAVIDDILALAARSSQANGADVREAGAEATR